MVKLFGHAFKLIKDSAIDKGEGLWIALLGASRI